jgi:predicted AlkP superfamily pyrophosphatase or phosphodiesterase
MAGSPNSPTQQKKHYVVLVSLDGFRYDYPKKFGAPHIAELARTGATAPQGMLPSYPSITFPNHFTLVTGLYPEHHGIVGNVFYDPIRNETYSYRDPKTTKDGGWYKGTPPKTHAKAIQSLSPTALTSHTRQRPQATDRRSRLRRNPYARDERDLHRK